MTTTTPVGQPLPSLRVGVDLTQVSQVAASLARLGDAYVKRLFTPAEIAYCSANPTLAPERFAARFAAKEAARKALRLGDEGLDLRQIEVKRTAAGWCDLILHGRARALAQRARWTSWSVSLSHEGDYATAVVVALADGRETEDVQLEGRK
jgi:holo-[acyl-carrier protein] synthase